jgi:hypothetical protein
VPIPVRGTALMASIMPHDQSTLTRCANMVV